MLLEFRPEGPWVKVVLRSFGGVENNFMLLTVKDLNCLEAETKIISTSITWLSFKGHLVMLK